MATFTPVGPAAPSSVSVTGTKSTLVTTGAVVGTVETTIVLPAGAKAFKLRTVESTNAVLTIAGSVGGTSSDITSFSIEMGGVWEEEGLDDSTIVTIYIKSSKLSTDVQVLYWT